MTESGLVLENIDVFYGSVHAVKDVSVALEPGKILALLGASGSGKSSLLRAIAGLEKAHGRVVFAGQDVADLPVYRRGFGLMFQDGQLFGHRNVGQNVAYGLKGRLPRAQWADRVEQLLDTVGLPGYADRAVSTLSGGQAQRVALARALAPQPRLLLLDEPLSALDRALREQLSVEIRQIVHRTHTTAVYVTHDQDEAFTVADTVAIMHEGELARIGTAQQVWTDPRTATVARFLGYGPLLDAGQAARFGVEVPADRLLACGPDAWRQSSEGVAVQVLESRTVRGAEEVVAQFADGVRASVDLPIGTDVRANTIRVALDPSRCAVVRDA
ncbi:MAG: ABC transporter ATP-binding protein [Actinomycetaceae bacterium]|nr:ABC transporter ATP-binding protein [Actinomycetaceae bacterium]